MANKDLVTKCQAKKLKRLGYDEPCTHYLSIIGVLISANPCYNYNSIGVNRVSVPTIDSVINWLSKKHSIYITVCIVPSKILSWKMNIVEKDGIRQLYEVTKFKSKEAVKRRAITKALSILINEQDKKAKSNSSAKT